MAKQDPALDLLFRALSDPTRRAMLARRAGGEWGFDMTGPDGAVWPNHHRYGDVVAGRRLSYARHAAENRPKHADARATSDQAKGETTVMFGMVGATEDQFQGATGFGAKALGQQTPDKLARQAGSD